MLEELKANLNEFYIYIDFAKPITNHNITFTKGIVSSAFVNMQVVPGYLDKYFQGSVDYISNIVEPKEKEPIHNGCLSFFNVNLLKDANNGFIENFYVDVDAEKIRAKFFPLMPSRLSAVYAFGDKESCLKANELYGWKLENIRKFKLIEHPLNKVTRANMELISYAREIYKEAKLPIDEKEKLFKTYWSGIEGKEYQDNVIWEYLIEGQLVLVE